MSDAGDILGGLAQAEAGRPGKNSKRPSRGEASEAEMIVLAHETDLVLPAYYAAPTPTWLIWVYVAFIIGLAIFLTVLVVRELKARRRHRP